MRSPPADVGEDLRESASCVTDIFSLRTPIGPGSRGEEEIVVDVPVGAKPIQQSCSWRVTAASSARASRGDRGDRGDRPGWDWDSLELGVNAVTSSRDCRDWRTSCMAVSSNLNCSRSTRA
mmetsp:Transcript_29295/g.47369  ORF Transcript_29295/g.47369 Transcript_29295/m.47369 type:complete len:121 (-) Transcript_29295:468-830(-)